MKVFKDIFTGDELFSDVYPIELQENSIYFVYGAYLTHHMDRKDATKTRDIDLVKSHKLQEIKFRNKEHFIEKMNKYIKRLVITLRNNGRTSEVKEFKANIKKFFRGLKGKFDSIQFFTGETMDSEAMIIMLEIKKHHGRETPCFMVIKHGLLEEDKLNKVTTEKEPVCLKSKIFPRKPLFEEWARFNSLENIISDEYFVPETPEKEVPIKQSSPIIERASKYKKNVSNKIETSEMPRVSKVDFEKVGTSLKTVHRSMIYRPWSESDDNCESPNLLGKKPCIRLGSDNINCLFSPADEAVDLMIEKEREKKRATARARKIMIIKRLKNL